MAKEYLTKLSQKELLGVTKTTLDAIVSLYIIIANCWYIT